MIRSHHHHFRHGWRPVAAVLAAVTLLLTSTSPAEACDSCNYSMLDEMLHQRADTALGRDILRAAENQRGLPLRGLSNVQQHSERMLEAHAAKQTSPAHGATSPAQSAEGPMYAPASAAADPAGSSHEQLQPISAPHEGRQAIIDRDEGLSIPPTSYVDQDVEADHHFTVRLSEGKTYIGNGVVYEGFLINDKVPGPTFVVTEGDVVEFTVINEGGVAHGASIHAAYTQTSAYLGSIDPGQTKSMKFRATYPGVFMYHCAPGGHAIPMHVMGGQYGMMVVKPKDTRYKLEEELGHGPDVEIFLNQHELYASGKDAVEGNVDYAMFNGKLFRYVEEPIKVQPGDYVRMYFLNVGPNLLSTFHIVGIIWDYVYWQGHPEAVKPGGQTVTAGPSDSWVIEFRIPPDEGAYTMLSHVVGSTSRGAIGMLVAEFDGERTDSVTGEGPRYGEQELAELEAEAGRLISPFGIGTAAADRPVRYHDPGEEVFVEIIGNAYSPKVIEVPVGTTVTWVNEDVFGYLAGEFSGVHNVATTRAPERFASPLLAHGESWSRTFDEAGEFEYICAPHPYMKGKVIVYDPAERGYGLAAAGGTWLPGWALALLGGAGGIAATAAAVSWFARRQKTGDAPPQARAV